MKVFVRDNIEAIIREAQGGIESNPLLRQGYYAARRLYENKYKRGMTYDAFEKAVKDVEKERGEYLFERDTRGHVYVPHQGIYEEVDLNVSRIIKKLAWRSFANILYVEKEGFREIIESAKIPEKYDLIVIYGKGFAVEGMSLLIEKLQEWLKEEQKLNKIKLNVFCLHDADPAGYMIYLDLIRGSWFSEKKFDKELLERINFVDLGLTVAQAKEYGLLAESIFSGSNKEEERVLKSLKNATEKTEEEEKGKEGDIENIENKEEERILKSLKNAIEKAKKKEKEKGGDVEKYKYFENDYNFFKKEGKRFELNAFSGGDFLKFLEKRLKERGAGKVNPTPEEIKRRVEDLTGVEFTQVKTKIFQKTLESALISHLRKIGLIDRLIDEFIRKIINEKDLSLERFIEEVNEVSLGNQKSWSDYIEEHLKFLEKEIKTKIEEDLNRPDSDLVKIIKTEFDK